MPKFMTYQRPVPVNKQRWSGKPGQAQSPIRKPEKVMKNDQPALPKLPLVPTRH